MMMVVVWRQNNSNIKEGKGEPSSETFSTRKHRDNGKLCFHNGSNEMG